MPDCVIDQRRPATVGLLCYRHFDGLTDLLDPQNEGSKFDPLRPTDPRTLPSIPALYAWLDAQPVRRELGSQALSGVFGSRPPGDLHIMALRDPRTRTDGTGRDDSERGAPMAVLTTLWEIVDRVDRTDVDGHLEKRPGRTVGQAAAWLHLRREWLAHQTWIDQAWTSLRGLHNQVRGAWGDPAMKPVGTCLQLVDDNGLNPDGPYRCATPLYLPEQAPRAMDEPIPGGLPSLRCGWCGWTYHGPELVRLGRERWEQARAKEAS